jgi:enoyl-[acyl-carrier protein] reductase I
VSFLDINDKTFLVFGVANRKSIAFKTAQMLEMHGAKVIYSVRSLARQERVKKLVPDDAEVYVCDVEQSSEIATLAKQIGENHKTIDGIVHSVAFANFEDGQQAFHQTKKENFLQTVDISCFSLVEIANAFKDLLGKDGSVVTVSISTTEMANENYGWMAPAKAALESSVCMLAKSFSRFSNVRFNAVCPGLLKTSASAGIPGYIDNYLYAEKCTLRGQAITTTEVASTMLFLLSPVSSGINGQKIVIDAGMRMNYFDKDIVSSVVNNI